MGLATAASAADRRIDVSSARVHRIFLPMSQSVTVQINDVLGDMVIADNKIADAQPMTDRTLYIIGKGVGTTSINLFSDQRRSLGVIEVEVGVDREDMAIAIRQIAPKARIQVGSVNGRVRLGGRVKDGQTLAHILEVAAQYTAEPIINAVTVEDSQQVTLEVRVLEVARNAGRELGVSWRAADSGNPNGTTPGSQSILGQIGAVAGTFATGNAPFATLIANVIDAGVNVDVVIRALEDKRLARRLAEPNLTALSGETASFLAGGEVPIPVARDEREITIEFKEYGVKLNFTPIVLDDSKINLRLNPEVSEVDPTTTIRTADIEIPAFVTRKASTVVELRDGQSFAIAGLLQSTNRKLQSQVPWLGQVPVLGALFRSSSYIKNETDLVIIVTPRLVRPAGPGQQVATPLDRKRPANDPEFFLLGQLEVTKEVIRAYELGEGVTGPYGHMLDVPKDQMIYVKK
ncbi:type II and III secretion system protein family protein [Nitratireductor sp. ZSWI3]|uniref:type II and III secretion system protein family protein n=1 Tax=Nitratireductor sp. ZSWI3 TaxID=2966359 RepID=UPI00214F8735|nr:type II and III secretion system protein family protein [Nitratireductor sp. ZSWI3]MCR4264850.1 type II and III secretion system protein family protein [Nitratireductor sp. ZSWI3]